MLSVSLAFVSAAGPVLATCSVPRQLLKRSQALSQGALARHGSGFGAAAASLVDVQWQGLGGLLSPVHQLWSVLWQCHPQLSGLADVHPLGQVQQ